MGNETYKILNNINLRRRLAGMTLAAIARDSGLSFTTVQRMLAGNLEHASFGNVQAVLRVLGMTIDCTTVVGVQELRKAQAKRKASRIVGMVQGTSGLEAQAVDQDTKAGMIEQTVCELLAGSPRKLWAE